MSAYDAPSLQPRASICGDCSLPVLEHGRGWAHLDGSLTCGGRDIQGDLTEIYENAYAAGYAEAERDLGADE